MSETIPKNSDEIAPPQQGTELASRQAVPVGDLSEEYTVALDLVDKTQREEDELALREIRERLGNVGETQDEKLLAPNGEPSNLNSDLWNMIRTPEFKSWFGDWQANPQQSSVMLDTNGEPIILYHGGPKGITQFDRSKPKNTGKNQHGYYFTKRRNNARFYAAKVTLEAQENGTNEEGKVYRAFLNIRNPIISEKVRSESIDELPEGSDGYIKDTASEVVVLHPEQIWLLPDE